MSAYNKLIEDQAMGDYDEEFDLMKQRQLQMQKEQQALQANSAQAEQPSSIGNAGSALTTTGAMTANPYVAGAGLTLQAIGMVDSAKRKSEQAKIDAYNNKIMAQRSAVRNMFS